MRAEQINKCAICGKGVCSKGHITFWNIESQRMWLDKSAINQVAGMETTFGGNVPLARFFCDAEVAKPIQDKKTILTVCETCAIEKAHWLFVE